MKIFLDSIGCRLNQAEIESMARQFRAAGHEIVASPEGAELAVMNTCAVTNDAASDSRRIIRNIARAGVKEIIATGCWATLQTKDAANLPNVSQVIPNAKKDSLVAESLKPSSLIPHPSSFDLEPLARNPLPGLHHRTRAFIKAQDGCDNHCAFCVTTVARGESRSRPLAEVISDIQFALDGGAKEVVLTGVHLGSWGQDFNSHLRDLVKAILRETDTPRLRLSSLEPWDLDASFFSLWKDARLAPHLHLPLQSGSSSTLKRMARKVTPDSFRELVRAARDVMPAAAITTDIIAGFPAETEAEFEESLAFVNEMNFAGGHVFTYSPRAGTGAAKMKGQVKPEVRKSRNHILRGALDESAKLYREKFIGQTLSVLWESTSEMGEWGWQMEGWTENYLRVKAVASAPRWNQIDKVKLIAMDGESLKGEIS
ncbi:MAG: tRNA (N(6)-L-threonylcarbamoyladenosine(37)-C(2))-methylthiotransferase MtaB [Anaerolineales bacterium]|nr:tRNA (N(6)-L-threonylcarbamoyladenosine(37)-C(2))-methylthiotransferase MtaB [Anaerolineales bacterium]